MSQTNFPGRFEPGTRLFIERETDAFTIQSCRWHRGQAVLKLAGVEDRDRAEALHGRYLRVPGDDLAELEEGEYYVFQVMGLTVVTETGRELGAIGDVLQTGANDVYVVPTDKGELLLPAIKDVVQEVDLKAGRMVVKLLPGLWPGEGEEV